jgi:hypothetical protein
LNRHIDERFFVKRNALTLTLLAALAPVAQAMDVSALPSSLVAQNLAGSIVVNFSSFTFAGFSFSQVTGLTTGKLTSVSVNATLDASVNYTYADDLTIYVTPTSTLASGGLLQVGGYSSTSAAERHSWANGASSSPGTTVIDTVTLTTPITFTGAASDPVIWLGNGYGDPAASGTWSGSITLNFTAAAVPEPGTWALGLAGGASLLAFMARRRRNAASAA